MIVMKRREKMVSIRLSDDEYQRLKEMTQAQGARSVSDVALDCGFESVGSFTTLFSRHFGISPGRFRSGE